MSGYQRMRLDDLAERQQTGQKLTEQEKRELATLMARDREEWEAQPAPRWLGGDYPDIF